MKSVGKGIFLSHEVKCSSLGGEGKFSRERAILSGHQVLERIPFRSCLARNPRADHF